MPAITLWDRTTDPTKPTPTFSRLFRAHVHAPHFGGVERTAFIEAAGHNDALAKIAAAIAAIEHRQPAEVVDRVYNAYSAAELIDSGVSEDLELRLMETGWSGNRATHFVEQPLFLVAEPAQLARIWARCPSEECGR